MAYWMACGSESWKQPLVAGIIFLVLGGLLFFFPEGSLRLFVFLFGLLAFIAGIGLFVGAWMLSRSGGMVFVVPLILGVCAVVLGILSFTDPELIGAFAAVLLGILLVIGGLAGAFSAVSRPGTGTGRALGLIGGLLVALLGFLILFWPRLSSLAIVRIIGVVFMAAGIIALAGSLVLAVRERSCAPPPGFERLERF
ncbi:MAG: hypothetical protein GKC05_07985 [Methanomicrobiales archaeon]|nr:hypothetical protein [Methanomicrobiales archaeon]NYT20445.1 hypothetical protein [Methanomicrobiales archaeon]